MFPVQWALQISRKAKALVARWFAKPVTTSASNEPDVSDTVIERGAIILSNVKIGRGASAANVACSFCVVNIYDKYYNK